MTTVYVQFSDASEEKVIAAFSCTQIDEKYQNQGAIDDSDPRYVAFINPGATKNGMWEKIKSERDRLTYQGGVLVNSRWFHTNIESIVRYRYMADAAAIKGKADTDVLRAAWRPLDVAMLGTVDMTYGLLKQIISAAIVQQMAIDDAAQSHKAAMEASAEPASYDFSGGWPATFS